MIHSYETIGEINDKAILNVYNKQALNQYLSDHKSKRVFVRIDICGNEPGCLFISYYKKVIVPAFQKGYYAKGNFYSCEQTDEKMREMCPICYNEEYDKKSQKWNRELKKIEELNTFDLTYFITFLKQVAAEEFNIYIEEPKTL